MNQAPDPRTGTRDEPELLSPKVYTTLVVVFLIVSVVVRLYKFPAVPVGLHWDEMSEAYESASLLKTASDRWAYHLPVYFLGWGSGQNVLQAYLTTPVIAALGLTKLSARFVPMLCGLLTVPLFFLTVRRWCGATAGLIGLVILSLSPWEIMLSRWGIENSPLPFFMILSVYCFGKALDSRSSWVIALSLIPFALSCYVYGVAILVLPLFLAMLFLLGRPRILADKRAWTIAAALCLLTSLPLGFFTMKNYVLKKNFGWERHLPFTAPLLPETRLSQVRSESSHESPRMHNFRFFATGLSDQRTEPTIFQPWYQVPGILPVQAVVLLFALVGIILQIQRALRSRNFAEPFLPWLLACLPLTILFPLNISRANPFFLPILALAAEGAAAVLFRLKSGSYRVACATVALLAVLVPFGFFAHDYFGPIYAKEITSLFRPHFRQALAAVDNLAGQTMPIYIDQSIQINYVAVLFYSGTDPHVFHAAYTTYDHPDFGPYRFSHATLNEISGPFAFLVDSEPPPCAHPTDTARFDQLLIGKCPRPTKL
jgi:4-amino-4-deoxy-L-arabinose transferase-like glycosyltransferase